jgi:hypothetical protein
VQPSLQPSCQPAKTLGLTQIEELLRIKSVAKLRQVYRALHHKLRQMLKMSHLTAATHWFVVFLHMHDLQPPESLWKPLKSRVARLLAQQRAASLTGLRSEQAKKRLAEASQNLFFRRIKPTFGLFALTT